MNRALLIISIFLVLFIACDREPSTTLVPELDEYFTSIVQGIYGRVLFWEGDFMPTYPEDDSGGEVYPVVRDVCIFKAVLHDDVEWTYVEIEPGCYTHLATAVPSDLVKVVKSNRKGYFEAELPPGRYSIFVREGGYYYANRVDGAGYVFPAEVDEDGTVGVQFDITYMATY
jgi:hypothetical protein